MDTLRRANEFLTASRSKWIDIHVNIRCLSRDSILVSSIHLDSDGSIRENFQTIWEQNAGPNTEYGNGLSIVHDLKDHTFFGLGVCPLTEIQTLVQTHFGRDMAHGLDDISSNTLHYLLEAIHDELYGPRGPRVYGQLETGTLDLFAKEMTNTQRSKAYSHMIEIVLGIIWPTLKPLFIKFEELQLLSLSTTSNPKIVHTFLDKINWIDKEKLLFRLKDNIGFSTEIRAYIFEEAYYASKHIMSEIEAYKIKYEELYSFGRVFCTKEYLLY